MRRRDHEIRKFALSWCPAKCGQDSADRTRANERLPHRGRSCVAEPHAHIRRRTRARLRAQQGTTIVCVTSTLPPVTLVTRTLRGRLNNATGSGRGVDDESAERRAATLVTADVIDSIESSWMGVARRRLPASGTWLEGGI